MKHIKELMALSVLGLTLAANPTTYGAVAPTTPVIPETPTKPETPPAPTDRATPAAPATPAIPKSPTDAAVPATPATPATPAAPTTPPTPDQPETPTKPDTSVKPASPTRPERPQMPEAAQVPAEMKKAIEAAKAQRTEFLSKQADLLKSLQGADAAGREQLRAQLNENRQQFLTAQRDSRTDLRKTIQDLKDKLADHGDVIDYAKAQAKENGKTRKGGE